MFQVVVIQHQYSAACILLKIEDDIYDAISLETCVDKRTTIGAPGPDAMKKVIEIYKEYLSK